jgi:hypothetical protein
MQAALASPQGQAVNADAATFLDLSKLQFLVVQEDEIPVVQEDEIPLPAAG